MSKKNELDPRRWSDLPEWSDLPGFMQKEEVRPYYNALCKHRVGLKFKRVFDIVVAWIMLVILAIPMGIVAILIKTDSPGPVFYRQERVTTYGSVFNIHKFRTMVQNADKIGSAVTVSGDSRITKVGQRIRGLRIDEIPQLFDVIEGTMSFVGPRPEAVKYVKQYTPKMMASLLLPAGVTSEASIRYKNEADLLDAADDVDRVYVEQVMPAKMRWNLESVRKYCFLREIATCFRTLAAVLGKEYV